MLPANKINVEYAHIHTAEANILLLILNYKDKLSQGHNCSYFIYINSAIELFLAIVRLNMHGQ